MVAYQTADSPPPAGRWDHLLVDPNDPEQRITDPAEHRFVATAIPSARQLYLTFALLIAVSSVYPISQHFTKGFEAITAYGPLFSIAVLSGIAVLWFLALRRLFTKQVVLKITTDGLTMDNRPGEHYSLRDAELAQWRSAWGRGGYRAGRALCLMSGPHRFVLADGASRPTREVPVMGSQVKARHLDAWMSTSAYDELLAIAASAKG